MKQIQDLAISIARNRTLVKQCEEYGIAIDTMYDEHKSAFVFQLYYLHTTYVDSIEMPVSTFEYYSGSEVRIAGINSLIDCLDRSWKAYLNQPAKSTVCEQPMQVSDSLIQRAV